MKLYIEDLMVMLANYNFVGPTIKVSSFDSNIVTSLGMNCMMNSGLTEKQRAACIRLCQKYRKQLVTAGGQDVQDALDNEEFKSPLKSSAPVEHVVQVDNKKISVKFPFDQELVNKIKEYKTKFAGSMVNWNPDKKSWDFDLEESNLLWVQSNVINERYTVDSEFTDYVSRVSEIFDDLNQSVPMLVYEDSQFKFKNTHPSVPQPETDDIKKALLLARTYGITTWDENVEKMKKTEEFSPILDLFLSKSDQKLIEIDSDNFSIDHFSDLFKLNSPALIVVPGGNELQSLRTWYFWLKSQNFQENEISVMFRLDNNSNSAFNDIVKEYKLNNPITENTKVVFISQKLPKPVIKSGINFGFVLNLSATWSSHYSINGYLDTMTDVIRYAPASKSKGLNEIL